MRANLKFKGQPKWFWAHVRSISEAQGYTAMAGAVRASKGFKAVKGSPRIKTLDTAGIVAAFKKLELSSSHLVEGGVANEKAVLLIEYFAFRANVLDNFVRPRLMNVEQAKALYELKKEELRPVLSPAMNKQKGDMAKVAYLTALVNMIVESVAGRDGFNPNPGQLTTFTSNAQPLRTLARRVDGALPGVVNPIALWEIKEYYYTTTFGSRVADGVYETLLDGMELEEMREHEGRNVEHALMVDAHFTWWVKGRSYLCRIIDMLHMGYVDEVLFGSEVVERLPALAAEWVELAKNAASAEPQLQGAEEAPDAEDQLS